jgi:hypothetical protein
LAGQEPSPGYGRCLVRVCPEKAFSPLGLCSRHDARYQREGRPGGAALPGQWGNRYERAGRPVPVEYADEPSFGRWCAAAAAVLRPGRVNLRGLHPLLRAEIQWGMCWHTRRQHGKWELASIQRLADYGRARGLRSLTDLDPGDPGLRKAAGREGARIACSIAAGLHPSTSRPGRPARPATSSPGTSGASSATALGASTWTGSPSGGCATLSGTISPMSCGPRPARALAAPSTTPGAPGWS